MTHLQISDIEPRILYSVGTTAQSTFQIPFEFTAFKDIRVWVDGVEANYTTSPTTSTEFSVAGNAVDGGYDGGSITLGAAITNATVVIVADIAIERTTDFPYPSSVLNIKALNTELDRLTAIARQLESQIARAIRQPETDATLAMELPAATARAGKYLGFDTSGAVTTITDDPSAATPGLKFDGITDEADALQALIDDDLAKGTTYRAIVSPPGGVLAIGRTINIRNRDSQRPYVLDFRRCSKIKRLDYGVRIRALGSFSEFPTSNLYRLSADANQNDTSITIDASPQNGDMSRFVVGARIIIRGEQDKHGEPMSGQRHEAIITAVSGATVTFANDPLPADFKIEYPNSAWTPEGGGPDRTLVTVVDEWTLSADAAEGARVLSLSTDPTGALAVGDWVYVQDDRTAGDVQGTSSNRIRLEVHRVQAVSSTTVTLDVGVVRDFQTSYKARITKLRPCWQPTIICPPETEFAQAPAAAPASRIPAWEAKYCIEPTIIGARLDDTATTHTTRGQLVRMEACYRPRVVDSVRIGKLDTSDASSGDRYGLYFVGCRDGIVEGGFFERCRHGIAFGSSNTNMLVRGAVTDDCLINGLDTHGGDNIGITFASCLSVAGPSRPPDATNQSAGTVGNPTHQAGDRDVRYLACTFRGFQDTDGAIDVHAPSKGVSVVACVAEDCVDVVTCKGDGSIDGGEIAVDSLVLGSCTGYAVDDDTTGTKFSRISIGTVLTDGSEAGIHSQGASGAALRPDLVPDKGSTVEQTKQISTTPYSTTRADRYLSRSGYDVVLTKLEATAGNAVAQRIDLHNDAKPLEQIVVAVPDSKTADVTIGLQSGATFQDGSTTWRAATAFGNGVERKLVFECAANADGASASWKAAGDVAPKDGYWSLADPLVAALGRRGVRSFSGAYTLAEADQGYELEYTGTTSGPLTLPAAWNGVQGAWPGFNAGSAALTISGATSGSVSVPAGETFAIFRSASEWRVVLGGSYTAMT